jgi:hypothetical protein
VVIPPSRGLFYCFDAKVGGDCLARVQHITGLDDTRRGRFHFELRKLIADEDFYLRQIIYGSKKSYDVKKGTKVAQYGQWDGYEP